MKAVKFARHERGLPPASEVEELSAFSGSLAKGGLAKIVSGVESSVITLGEAMQEIAILTQQRFDENEQEYKSMMGVLQNLFATLGPTVEIDANLEAPTLWGTTAFIAEEVVRLGGIVDCLAADVKPMVSAIKAVELAHDESSKKAEVSENMVMNSLELVMDHVNKVAPELTKLRDAMTKYEAGEGFGTKGGSPTRVSGLKEG